MNCSTPGFPVPESLLKLMLTESVMASLVAQMRNNLPAMQEMGFNPWVGKLPWGREQLPTPVLLPGDLHGQRSLVGCSAWGCKESDTTAWITLSLHCQFIKKHLAKFNSYSQQTSQHTRKRRKFLQTEKGYL